MKLIKKLLLLGALVAVSFGCDEQILTETQELDGGVIDLRSEGSLRFGGFIHNLGTDEDFVVLSATAEGDFETDMRVEGISNGAYAKPEVGYTRAMQPGDTMSIRIDIDRSAFEVGEHTVQVVITGNGHEYVHKIMFQNPEPEFPGTFPVLVINDIMLGDTMFVENHSFHPDGLSFEGFVTDEGDVRLAGLEDFWLVPDAIGTRHFFLYIEDSAGNKSFGSFRANVFEPSRTDTLIVRDSVTVEQRRSEYDIFFPIDRKVTMREDERYADLGTFDVGDESFHIEALHRWNNELSCSHPDDRGGWPQSIHFGAVRIRMVIEDGVQTSLEIWVLTGLSGDTQRFEEAAFRVNGKFTQDGGCPIVPDPDNSSHGGRDEFLWMKIIG